jgi:hypothetical protein
MIMVDVLQLIRQTMVEHRDRVSKFLSRLLGMSLRNQVADKAYFDSKAFGSRIPQERRPLICSVAVATGWCRFLLASRFHM